MKIFKLFLSLVFGVLVISCAPVQFEQKDCGNFEGKCVRINGLLSGTKTLSLNSGVIDILVVVDNSASMSFEQKKMGDRFKSFLDSLDAKKVDYRFSITTTDISDGNNPHRAINLDGALQDGNLIKFANGELFLNPNTADKESLFLHAVARYKLDGNDTEKETGTCENYLKSLTLSADAPVPNYNQYCPSQDERGIYASYLAISKNQVVRSESDKVAVIYLGDEDIRSGLYYSKSDNQKSYFLDALDTPQNLIQYFKATYPKKTLTLHSLVVSPGPLKEGASAHQVADAIVAAYSSANLDQQNTPNHFFPKPDATCLKEQNGQGTSFRDVSGSFGYMYALGSLLTGGVVGSICSQNFDNELGDISNILTNNKFQLCEGAQVKSAKLLDGNGNPTVDVAFTMDGDQISFANKFDVGTKVQIELSCKK